ncbi:MAG: hypothetical protein KF823_14165 [Xanthomonadales bacterium]|nr:hypothetical protein [Xanthomonadales bacterium]
MRTALLFPTLLVAALAAPVARAQLDCTALANSTAAEPAGYAAQCGGPSAHPTWQAPRQWRDPTDTGFSYNMSTGFGGVQGLKTYVLNDFTTQTVVGNPGASFFALDFDPAGNVLYAVQAGAPPVLGTINTGTGVFTPIANVSVADPPTGLSIDPVTGDAWYSTPTNLYTLDLATAVATLVGPFGTTGMIDIAMNCDGDLYGHDIGTDALYSIDTATGTATLIGGHGLAANFAQGMDFDNSDGTLYAAIYTGSGTYTYGTFNLATGAIIPLSTNNPPGEWELAIPTTCGSNGNEVEPNDSKAEANALQLPPVSTPAVMTGSSQSASGVGLDYFRVTTAAQATAGFYRHRLIVTSTTPGHTATIRGLNQAAGVIGTTDTAVQTSSAATTPARFVQWYTSEIPADIYVRLTGTGTTTDPYVLNYEIEAVTVVEGPDITFGSDIDITTVGQTTTDTDMWVYDGDRLAIVGFGNDDQPAPGTGLQSRLTRTFAPGIYYLAISNYNFANNLASPPDDRFLGGAVLDFPGAIANSSTALNLPLNPLIDGSPVTVSRPGPFDVVFISFGNDGPPDIIFRGDFECDTGFPGCNGGGTPGVYTDLATFLQNVSPGYYAEDFASVPGGSAGPSMNFSGNGFAFTITATGPGSNNLFNEPGIISTDSALDAIVLTFTGAPVTAIGGNFWATDFSFAAVPRTMTLTLSDSTVETYTSSGPGDFRGFVTAAPITSITIDAADTPANGWSTMDNVVVGD